MSYNSELQSNNTDLQSILETINNLPAAGGGVAFPTLTNEGSAADLLSDKQLIDQEGNIVTGTIATKTSSNITASGATVTIPAGYYASQTTKSVTTATQATPSISVNSSGLITASATQTAGYVSVGTKSATKQLTTQAAQTITPGITDKTIASGRYLIGTQTIKGDANLIPANIVSGKSIFGVSGTATTGGSSGSGVNVETCTVTVTRDNFGSYCDVGWTALENGNIITKNISAKSSSDVLVLENLVCGSSITIMCSYQFAYLETSYDVDSWFNKTYQGFMINAPMTAGSNETIHVFDEG